MYLSVVVFVDGEDIITFVIYEETVCRSHLCAGLSHFFFFHIWPSDSTIIQCAFRFLQCSAVCMLILSVVKQVDIYISPLSQGLSGNLFPQSLNGNKT